jgi:HSP20 family protein
MSMLTRFERWDPFEELTALRNRMDRIIARADDDVGIQPGRWAPTTDVVESDDAILLKAELPGVDRKDISIDIENNLLTLQGEREYKGEKEEKGFKRIERSYGRFVRAFTIPSNVDTENIKATYADGLLEVTMPKTAEKRSKKIDIGEKNEPKAEKRTVTAA